MTPTRGRKSTVVPAVQKIRAAITAATNIVNNPEIPEIEWTVALKTTLVDESLKASDSDLKRYLRQAKAARDGRQDFINPGDEIDLREDEWILEGVLMRHATNMIFALPKVGKTRLMLAVLGALHQGRGEFAGFGLHGRGERLLLLGPDQSKRSWGNYMKKAGLLTEDNRLPEYVVGMTTAESNFCLNDEWLADIERLLKENGPLIVLLDSYSAAIRSERLDENKPEAVIPLQQLHNLVMAYESTLIVIHHSNKAGGDGDVTKAARGSSAITAAVDNLIGMRKWAGQEEPGIKKYELVVTGRAETDGTPLIGYEKHSGTWVSCGSAREAREEEAKGSSYDELSTQHLAILDALVVSYRATGAPLSVKDVIDKAVSQPTKSTRVLINKSLRSLEKKGFVRESQNKEGQHYKQAIVWEPTAWALVKHKELTF